MLIAWILIPLGLLAALYGFHRFMLYLECCDLFSSWRSASGGSGYNPLLEIYQPQVRHVVQVQEQRLGDCEDDAGGPAPASKPGSDARGSGVFVADDLPYRSLLADQDSRPRRDEPG